MQTEEESDTARLFTASDDARSILVKCGLSTITGSISICDFNATLALLISYTGNVDGPDRPKAHRHFLRARETFMIDEGRARLVKFVEGEIRCEGRHSHL
jgi:hypothetical protein